MANTKQVQVRNMRPGQRFIWAGHVVTYLHSQDHYRRRSGKQGRRLIVQDGDQQHALWYLDRERVTLVASEA